MNIEELYEVMEEFHDNCKDIDTLDELLEHIDQYNEELEKNLIEMIKQKKYWKI